MGSVLEVTASDWEKEVLESDVLTVVDFWQHHCPWCLSLDPILDEVSEEYKGKIKFTKIDFLKTPENLNLAVQHGIMSTPTLVFFCTGRPIQQAVGLMPKQNLEKLLDDVLEKHKDCFAQSTKIQV